MLAAGQRKRNLAHYKLIGEQYTAAVLGQANTENMERLEVEWMKACDQVEYAERALAELKLRLTGESAAKEGGANGCRP